MRAVWLYLLGCPTERPDLARTDQIRALYRSRDDFAPGRFPSIAARRRRAARQSTRAVIAASRCSAASVGEPCSALAIALMLIVSGVVGIVFAPSPEERDIERSRRFDRDGSIAGVSGA